MSRWGRAKRALHVPAGSRVLDLGCAFGFGTKMLTGRYETYGHDLSASYIRRARRSVPEATFTVGHADTIPYPDGFFDAVLLLDVLEHVPDERAVVNEIVRVLRPGGELVTSVPNRGLLAPLDSLNLYERLLGQRALPPTDDPSWPLTRVHRHYSAGDLEALLGSRFKMRASRYTGIGIAEPINLILLLLFRAMLPQSRLYGALQYIYFGVYLAEDMIPTGAWGYHLMLEAELVESPWNRRPEGFSCRKQSI